MFVVFSTQEGSKTTSSKFHDSWNLCQVSRPIPQPNLVYLETNQDGLVLPPNFANLIFITFVVISTQEGSKTVRSKIHDSWHLCRAIRPRPPPNLAHFKTNRDGLVLPPNFANLVFIAFVALSNQEGSKNARSKIHEFLHLCWASRLTQPPNLAHLETNRDGLVLPPNFDNLIFIAFVVLSIEKGTKTARSKFHDFWHLCRASLTSPPNLAHFKTNQDGLVLPQTLSTSFLLYLWSFPTKRA